MKKTLQYIPVKWLLVFCIITITAISCKKTFNSDFDLPRQFTPGTISIVQGETQVRLSWNPSLFTAGKDVTYTVEVSKDVSFATIDYTSEVDTATIIITDTDIDVRQPYFARVKANALGSTAESGWVVSNTFQITGEQIIYPILDVELKDVSVTIRWKPTTGLTKIVTTPVAGGTPITTTLDATDLTNAYKLITGLSAQTDYRAEIFRNNTSKGFITFTTKFSLTFTVVLNPGDDIVTAVNNAANGDVIGLNPGTYNATDGGGTFTNLTVLEKTITIASVSDNPLNTKVNYKEINLKGTGAGITLKGIEFDGAPSTANGQAAFYFINLTGTASDGAAAVFTNIIVENCRVHNMANTFMRGNRGGNNAHKVNSIQIKNSFIYDLAQVNTNYSFFQINKMEFVSIDISNSTLYSIGRALVDWDANITVSPQPTVTVDHCTINNIGLANMSYILFDANANDVKIALKNSILGNSPYPGETVQSLIRATGAQISFENSNYFNLMDGGAPSVPLDIPANVVLTDNSTIDLGWTAGTTTFTLPAASPLRTASSTGGIIGDPRWGF